MRKLKWLFIVTFISLSLFSCKKGNDEKKEANNNTNNEKKIEQNTEKKQIGNENMSEDVFISNFMNNLKNEDYSSLSDFFIDKKVYEMYNPGAFIFITLKDYEELLKSPRYSVEKNLFNGKIIKDKMPVFSMDSYEWSENGFFLEKITTDSILSVHTKYVPEAYDENEIKAIEKAEKNITHKLLIAYNDGITIYFGKIENNWKIIAIDISTNDA